MKNSIIFSCVLAALSIFVTFMASTHHYSINSGRPAFSPIGASVIVFLCSFGIFMFGTERKWNQ